MRAVDVVLERNRTFAAAFAHGDAPSSPSLGLAVLTCMDGRVQPARFLELGVAEAHVLRNAGGRATDDALRSIIVSTQLLGTRACMVIHHTDCGMQTFTNDAVRARLEADTGANADHIDFLPFTDLEESVRADVGTIRESPLLPDDLDVTGWVYDVRTGRLTEVTAPS